MRPCIIACEVVVGWYLGARPPWLPPPVETPPAACVTYVADCRSRAAHETSLRAAATGCGGRTSGGRGDILALVVDDWRYKVLHLRANQLNNLHWCCSRNSRGSQRFRNVSIVGFRVVLLISKGSWSRYPVRTWSLGLQIRVLFASRLWLRFDAVRLTFHAIRLPFDKLRDAFAHYAMLFSSNRTLTKCWIRKASNI